MAGAGGEAGAGAGAAVSTIFRDDLFADRVAFITGGATGIGLRIAREFVRLGGTVILASRNEEQLKEAVSQLNAMTPPAAATTATTPAPTPAAAAAAAPARAFYVTLNIRSGAAAIAAALQQAILLLNTSSSSSSTSRRSSSRSIDYLINNAGGQYPAAAAAITAKGWAAVIETNMTGPFFMAQQMFLLWQQQQQQEEEQQQEGKTVAAAGTAAGAGAGGKAIVSILCDMWNGFPGMSHTGAARAGVDNLTKSLSQEWAHYGVRVNAVAPGVIASSGLSKYPSWVRPVIEQSASYNYCNRLGTEAEVAASVLFLLSPAAAFITGVTLRIDGGESIYSPYAQPQQHNNIAPFTDPAGSPSTASLLAAAATAGDKKKEPRAKL